VTVKFDFEIFSKIKFVEKTNAIALSNKLTGKTEDLRVSFVLL